jgi:hypothetical protein
METYTSAERGWRLNALESYPIALFYLLDFKHCNYGKNGIKKITTKFPTVGSPFQIISKMSKREESRSRIFTHQVEERRAALAVSYAQSLIFLNGQLTFAAVQVV